MSRVQRIGKSITVRLMVIFLCTWAVVSILMVIAFGMSQRELTKKIMEGQRERVRYYAAIVNADLSRITDLLRSMCVDDDVAAFFRTRDENFNYEDYEAFTDSYEKLKSYRNSSMYIDDVFLALPQTNELLRATRGVVSIPEGYGEAISRCVTETDEVFFAVNDNMIYLSRGFSNTVVGIEVSVRHIRSMLNALNPGYFDCFLVNRNSRELLGKHQVTPEGQAVYRAIMRAKIQGKEQAEGSDPRMICDEAGQRYLYDCVETPGNHFQLYLFAHEEKVYADLYIFRSIWVFLTVMMVVIPIFIGYLFSRTLSRPMKKLVTAMKAAEEQVWTYRLQENESAEFSYVFRQYNNMVQRMETLIQEVYEKQVQVEQAKRRQLQAQINPHFLYNSFYMGYRMARSGESEKVANLCMYLGDYFKVMTYASDNPIPLEQEIKFVDTYLRLNKMRFEDKLGYELRVDTDGRDILILPLLLQPLVENAIRHGVERVQKPCKILVKVTRRQGMAVCSVTDDCGTVTPQSCERMRELIRQTEIPTESFGLWNIEQRLLTLGEEDGLHFELRENGDFQVWFQFKARSGKEERLNVQYSDRRR